MGGAGRRAGGWACKAVGGGEKEAVHFRAASRGAAPLSTTWLRHAGPRSFICRVPGCSPRGCQFKTTGALLGAPAFFLQIPASSVLSETKHAPMLPLGCCSLSAMLGWHPAAAFTIGTRSGSVAQLTTPIAEEAAATEMHAVLSEERSSSD